jgi:hypothetical protein
MFYIIKFLLNNRKHKGFRNFCRPVYVLNYKKILKIILNLNFCVAIFVLIKFKTLIEMLSRKVEGIDPLKP